MLLEKVVLNTDFKNLKFVKKGKVRDIYEVGNYFLIVSTDRLSAFDVVMQQGIPFKGIVLNKISEFWFDYSKDIIQNHIISTNVKEFPAECREYLNELNLRSMLVKKTKVVPIECIIRGYISGSGWNDYKASGEICGIKLPANLVESEKFSEPLFTPSTKAEVGEHDENISSEKAIKLIGEELFYKIKNAALMVYKKCSDFALSKGIIIADTKMEFGLDENKNLILIDELLTPDSSRFWPLEQYKKGESQNSLDKQFVRDYLLSVNFNKKPPAPILPENIIQNTSSKYLEALKIITGIDYQN